MNGRRLALYGACAILAYVVALLALAPAAWLAQSIERASRERLELRDATGSAWSGSGRLYARTRAGEFLDLGSVRWKSSPATLLRGRLGADMTLNESAKPVRLELGPGGIEVKDLALEVPGKALGALAPPLEILGPGGRVRVQSDDLRVDGESVLGLATVEWRDIRLARASGIELGSHVARLRGAGSRVDIELATLDGPLRVSGSGSWSPRGGLALTGTAEPRPEAAATLVPFLRGVCPEFRDGRCIFQIKY
jgi:general secretion pathway protein N